MWTLFQFEVRHLLRDLSQLLIITVIVPLLLAPFVMRSFEQVNRRAQEAQQGTFFVVVHGPRADFVRELLPKLRRFRELPPQSSPEDSLRQGLIDIYLTVKDPEGPPPPPRSSGLHPKALAERQPETPLVTVHYSSGRERSLQAREAIQLALHSHLQDLRNQAVQRTGHDPKDYYKIEMENLASNEQEHLQSLSALIPLVLVFVLFGAGSVTALDAIAGERERGSLATVLVSALTRWEIVLGKWLAVLAVSLGFGLLQFIGLYWRTSGFGGKGLNHLASASWLEVLLLALLMAAQISALLLWISVRSSSFKQAQLLYMPALLVGAALSGVGWMQTLPLHSVVSIVPISGLTLAIRDVLLHNASTLWLGVAVLASLGWTVGVLNSVRNHLQFDEEDHQSDSPQEQMRQQLGQDIFWFYAFAAAAMVVLPGNFPVFSQLQGQVLLNQGMFLLTSLALLRLYRQPLASALRLRSTSAANWAICLLLMPLLHICANSVAIVSSWLVPMSEENVRQMTELLLPDGIARSQLYVLIALAPAVCEELAFRGTLLHALQNPWANRRSLLSLCLWVGVIFGCFHFSVQRLLPTTIIGCLLTLVAIRSGSLFPCMVLHLANNALAIYLHDLHLDYTAFPAWTWLAAWALLSYLLTRLTPPQGAFPPVKGNPAPNIEQQPHRG